MTKCMSYLIINSRFGSKLLASSCAMGATVSGDVTFMQ